MKKLGFTLAEVLITLVIIGIIAAMTVPTLMNNTNSQEYRTAYKKAISAMNQALQMNYALEGLQANDYADAATIVDELFAKRLNVIEYTRGDHAAWDNSQDRASKSKACSGAAFTTADGIMYCIESSFTPGDAQSNDGTCDSNGTNPCNASDEAANVLIDVNGSKKPNAWTTNSRKPRDVFQAQLYSQRVIPWGGPSQQVMYDAGYNETTHSAT